MRIFFSTGEASGEYHAVALLQAMRRRSAEKIEAAGIGAERMRSAGVELWADNRTWAAVGVVDAVEKIPRLAALGVGLAIRLLRSATDVAVLIDFGAFNLRLARLLRTLRFRGPIVYYIPPSAWLDDPVRARKVARASTPLTIFRHQRDFYAGLGLEVFFFGHPLVSLVAERPRRPAPPATGGTIAILPGSRRGELERHVPPLLAAAEALALERPLARFLVGAAHADARAFVAERLTHYPQLSCEIVDGAQAALAGADAAWIASGTAVLEAALMGIPSVLLYITSNAQARIARRVMAPIGREFIGLPNLVLGRAVVPEILQDSATPWALTSAMREILRHPEVQLDALGGLREALGPPDALDRCAEFVLERARP
ncbi:MAG: hypothetical protein JO101_12425 [Candidatus Eremiobacteraeota bacterium]|nr:hypothetical protein [Candidatus Eremiobacteraeota bacterium]MBV8356123.1 hypothetical protein [Candidatus Eremiobacteraeota bacterium]